MLRPKRPWAPHVLLGDLGISHTFSQHSTWRLETPQTAQNVHPSALQMTFHCFASSRTAELPSPLSELQLVWLFPVSDGPVLSLYRYITHSGYLHLELDWQEDEKEAWLCGQLLFYNLKEFLYSDIASLFQSVPISSRSWKNLWLPDPTFSLKYFVIITIWTLMKNN